MSGTENPTYLFQKKLKPGEIVFKNNMHSFGQRPIQSIDFEYIL